MARTKGTKTIVTVSLDTALVGRVDALAAAQGRSRSWLLEHWIREKIGEDELAVKAFTNPVLIESLMKAFGNPEFLKTVCKAVGEDVNKDELNVFRQGMEVAAAANEAAKKARSRK